MSKLTKAQFLEKYAILFADNSTRNITESVMRSFCQDLADSTEFSFGSELDIELVVTSGSSINFDFGSGYQSIFVGISSFSTPKTITFSNTTNAKRFEFIIENSSVDAVITFPSSVIMNDIRWDEDLKQWYPDDIGVYKGAAIFDGTNWILDMSQSPYA